MNRRDFLLFGAKSAAVILTPGLLMPVKTLVLPATERPLTATDVIAYREAWLNAYVQAMGDAMLFGSGLCSIRDIEESMTFRAGLPTSFWRKLRA